jgi:hypothetical protein
VNCHISLGIPKLIIQEVGARAVAGHFNHPHQRPWKSIDETVVPGLAKVVGMSRWRCSPALSIDIPFDGRCG